MLHNMCSLINDIKIMKKLFVMLFSVTCFVAVQAQDNVVLKNGDTLCVKVVKNDEKTIVYQYPGEILFYVKI